MFEPVSIVAGLSWIILQVAEHTVGAEGHELIRKFVAGAVHELTDSQKRERNNDVAWAVRCAQIDALERAIGGFAIHADPQQDTDTQDFLLKATEFCRSVRRRLQDDKAELNFAASEELTGVIEVLLAEKRVSVTTDERAEALGAFAEEAVLNELRDLRTSAPEAFVLYFRRGAGRGHPRFLDLFGACIAEQLKEDTRFREILQTSWLADLKALGFEATEALVRVEKQFGGLSADVTEIRRILRDIVGKLSERTPRGTKRFSRLPPTPFPFIGRCQQLKELLSLPNKGGGLSVITIEGEGAIGKTAFACHAARQLIARGEFEDPPIFIDMRGFSECRAATQALDRDRRRLEPTEALRELISQLDIAAPLRQDDSQLGPIWRDLTKNRRLLIVFDNVENDAHVEPLLLDPDDHRHCVVIITSRTCLAVGHTIRLPELSPTDARELILRIANSADKVRLTGEECDLLAEKCRYVPMALRLTAADLKMHRARDVARYINEFDEEAKRHARFAAVFASLRVSLRALPEEERSRWASLGLFAGNFGKDAVIRIWDSVEAERTLEELCALHLLEYDNERNEFRLPGLMPDLAMAVLRQDKLLEQTYCKRHSQYSVDKLLECQILLSGDFLAGLTLFERWKADMIRGQTWAAENMDLAEARGLVGQYAVCAPIVLSLLGTADRLKWLKAADGISSRSRSTKLALVRLTLAINLGTTYLESGQIQHASQTYADGFRLARHLSTSPELQEIIREELYQLYKRSGLLHHLRGRNRRALTLYEKCRSLMPEICDFDSEFACSLGDCLADLGQPEAAIVNYQTALSSSKNNPILDGHVLDSWARALIALKDYGGATKKATEGVAVGHRISNARVLSECYNAMAISGILSGDVTMAEYAAEKSQHYHHERHAYLDIDTSVLLGIAALSSGNAGRARAAFENAIRVADHTLESEPMAFWKLYSKALALSGLEKIEEQPVTAIEETDSYRKARTLNCDPGVTAKVAQLYNVIVTANTMS